MASPLRVGILNDMSNTPRQPSDIEQWLALAARELQEAGRLDREVEFVHACGLGLPQGTAAAVETAFEELVAQHVLLVVGPAIGDNALVATPLADAFGVPTLNWAGSERARGEYMFHLQVGSHEDESIVIARHLATRGLGRIAVIADRSPIGRRYQQFLLAEAEILGLDIAAIGTIAPLAEDADSLVRRVVGSEPDAVVYLGLGQAAPAVAGALVAQGWSGARIMNTAGIRGHHGDFAAAIDGWHYLDMYSDANFTLAGLCARLDQTDINPLSAAKGYDLGRLAAEGLARADELTREGVKRGLELIKWLPAAQGHEGTLLGFGHWDRGALHGRYLVTRQWLNGTSLEVN